MIQDTGTSSALTEQKACGPQAFMELDIDTSLRGGHLLPALTEMAQ